MNRGSEGEIMARCPHCGEELPAGGAATAGPATARRPAGERHAVRLTLALGIVALLVVAGARAAGPLIARRHGCEPEGWRAWHAAMERACLEPAYVCEHMTTQRLLRDPEVAGAYGPEEASPRAAGLRSLVGRMRADYGCTPEAASAPGIPLLAPDPGFPVESDAPVAL